jgi:hypothetical protein
MTLGNTLSRKIERAARKTEFAAGSALEEAGFELLVPHGHDQGLVLEIVSQVSGDCLLVPLQPDARHVRDMQLATFDRVRS